MKIGYARVSTDEQNLALQLDGKYQNSWGVYATIGSGG